MFSTITKFFQKKKKKVEEALDIPKILILEDINLFTSLSTTLPCL